MAESSLSLGYTDYVQEIAHYLGYGRTVASLSADQLSDAEGILNAGMRQFYTPPVLPGERTSHDWTFLRPVTTLTTTADDYDYDLPADFGGIIGNLTYAVGLGLLPIVVGSEVDVRARRQRSDTDGYPTLAAVRPKAYDATNGQRFELLLWPTPDSAYVLTYQYRAIPNKLSSTNAYPLGGMLHGEALLASCLAVAERRRNDERGVQWEQFMERLAASVALDRKNGPHFLGYCGDSSDGQDEDLRGLLRENVKVAYNGVYYP